MVNVQYSDVGGIGIERIEESIKDRVLKQR